ncbi:MAG: hypothetical protein NTZ87_01470 [Candidatus Nomurabacteria bacterium]|nr:hypothetical protein [Candidatus Nomurabacteria bacterium]
MKKYKNVLLSLGSYILAFVWYIFWIFYSSLFSQPIPSTTGDVVNKLIIIVYFLFIIIGLFFGFRSRKKEPPLASSLIISIGIILLIGSYILYNFYSGLSG